MFNLSAQQQEQFNRLMRTSTVRIQLGLTSKLISGGSAGVAIFMETMRAFLQSVGVSLNFGGVVGTGIVTPLGDVSTMMMIDHDHDTLVLIYMMVPVVHRLSLLMAWLTSMTPLSMWDKP